MPTVPDVWLERALIILLVVVSAVVARWLLLRSVDAITKRTLERAAKRREGSTPADRLIAAATGVNAERFEQRARTIGSLLRNVISITIVVIAALTILAVLQVPLGPLLASAGVGGIALAFGAQSVVKDFLSGIFMIMEDQYGVGDLIDVGEVTGTVEEVGLRITRLRDPGGQVWYVRNGEVLRVGNQTQGWSTGIADIPIGNDEDAARALEILAGVVDEVGNDPEFAAVLLEKPTLVGVDSVSATGTILRIIAKTEPNKQWGVKRALLQRGIEALGEAGYHGPVVPPVPPTP
ncbi:MAG: mechanosensitive ion channel family protein [Propionicimonas sp.]|uniref:mechanosensitive ion channel family protein n=1 Tax=Propionicimonas sp. TaxID=1955623 RepID=UPI002B1EEF08|nr:mechanosensitive ion channel family protein [Propionicimonas sp.]MEA4944484.1 mechanosensitive ion channel family protein [Propionicimonas sp.]MEA5053065.1 mechanosensitive ion channel family protein [Propionicimonas sp.]MEA5116311.1 mechanosensitive ion channel family protein [Propionicimonas sp.]